MRAPCQYCDGDGFVKSPRTMCNEIYRNLEKFLQQKREKVPIESQVKLKILLHGEVLERMKDDANVLLTVEKKFNARLMFRADSSFHIEQYNIAEVNAGGR
jgi:ribonuclease G